MRPEEHGAVAEHRDERDVELTDERLQFSEQLAARRRLIASTRYFERDVLVVVESAGFVTALGERRQHAVPVDSP